MEYTNEQRLKMIEDALGMNRTKVAAHIPILGPKDYQNPPKLLPIKEGTFPVKGAGVDDPTHYIFLQGRDFGNLSYNYPHLLVHVTKIGQDISWQRTQTILAPNHMLTMRQFADFMALLYSGNVLDSDGKPLSRMKIAEVQRDIFDGGEWLDAMFVQENNAPHYSQKMHWDHKYLSQGVAWKEGLIEPHLRGKTQSRLSSEANFDLLDWANNSTVQGLPPENVAKGTAGFVSYKFAKLDFEPRVAAFEGKTSTGEKLLRCNYSSKAEFPDIGVRIVKVVTND